jgi:AraC-like DNA-binding protein
MHTLRCKAPSPQLLPFVRAYAEREIRDTDHIIKESIPARLEQTLEFQLGETFDTISPDGRRRIAPRIVAVGAHTEAGFSILLKKNVLSFGIFFQPDGLSRLFQFPMGALSHQFFLATDLFGPMISSLYSKLGDCESFAQRVVIAENFLLARAMLVQSKSPDAMEMAAARMFARHGALRVADAAAEVGLSLRQFQRKFLHQTGFSPKSFARVARFQTALDAKLFSPHMSWVYIAHHLGYHDQMHMVRDFHDLANAAPSQLLASIGDARPPAMVELNTF